MRRCARLVVGAWGRIELVRLERGLCFVLSELSNGSIDFSGIKVLVVLYIGECILVDTLIELEKSMYVLIDQSA